MFLQMMGFYESLYLYILQNKFELNNSEFDERFTIKFRDCFIDYYTHA